MVQLTIENVPGPWRCGHASKKDPANAYKHTNIQVTKIELGTVVAFFYYTPLVIDVDGAPNAYGPHGSGALDGIADAGDADKGYYGVVAYSPAELAAENQKNGFTGQSPDTEKLRIDMNAPCLKGRYPVFQRGAPPANRFYVSKNPLIVPGNQGLPAWDQRKYSDATLVPYGALGGKLKDKSFALGDTIVSLRVSNMRSVEYSFGDTAGTKSNNLAEVSLATALALGARNSKDNEFLSCHFAFKHSGRIAGFQAFHALSAASNASDVPYFVALQIQAGPSTNVIEKLRSFQALGDEQKMRLMPGRDYPPQYKAVVAALRNVGFTPAGSFDAAVSGMA